jgi:hypothetical protein
MPAPIGNRNYIKGKRWQQALERALARLGEGEIDVGLNPIADKVVQAAMAGDKDAWKELGDRLDGKPAQAITGEDGGPVRFEVVAPWMAQAVAARNE